LIDPTQHINLADSLPHFNSANLSSEEVIIIFGSLFFQGIFFHKNSFLINFVLALNTTHFDLAKTDSLDMQFSPWNQSSRLIIDFSNGRNSEMLKSILLGGNTENTALPPAPVIIPTRQIIRAGRSEIIIFDFCSFKIFDAIYLLGIVSIFWQLSENIRFNTGCS